MYHFSFVEGKQQVNLRFSLNSAQTASYYNDLKEDPHNLKFGKQKVELNVQLSHIFLSLKKIKCSKMFFFGSKPIRNYSKCKHRKQTYDEGTIFKLKER